MILPSQDTGTFNEIPRLLDLTQSTGYEIVQNNGQRIYGPPPTWSGPPPRRGCEVFVGKIPRDIFEDELVPFMERVGRVYETRLMMDFSGNNRGYAFVMYTNKDDAARAIKELNNAEIRKGRQVGVVRSIDNCRLFVGGLPKSKKKEEIKEAMSRLVEGVADVILYSCLTDKNKSRGFAFVEFDSHRSAAMARRKLMPGKIKLWGSELAIDWAEPEIEVDESIMSKVTVLYVRNLMCITSEMRIKDIFEKAGRAPIEKVKKIRDFAFVHYSTREAADRALQLMDGSELDGAVLEVTWAKPINKPLYRMHKAMTRTANQDFRKYSFGVRHSFSQHNGLVSWNSGSSFGTNSQTPEILKRPLHGAATFCGGRVPIQPNAIPMMMPVIPEDSKEKFPVNPVTLPLTIETPECYDERKGYLKFRKVVSRKKFYSVDPAKLPDKRDKLKHIDRAQEYIAYRMDRIREQCNVNPKTLPPPIETLEIYDEGNDYMSYQQVGVPPYSMNAANSEEASGYVVASPSRDGYDQTVIPPGALIHRSLMMTPGSHPPNGIHQEVPVTYALPSPAAYYIHTRGKIPGYEAAAYYDGHFCISEPTSSVV